MAAIFLSYAREDHACADRLAQFLEAAGHKVWWDRRIESGAEFAAEIEAALEAADLVLVLWSGHSVKSRWVKDEAAIGGDSGRLVPIAIDTSLPPIGFRQFQAFDLTGWKGGRRDPRSAELLAAIERRLERKAGEGSKPTAAALPRRAAFAGGRRWMMAALLALVVAAGAIALFLMDREPARSLSKPTIALLPFTSTAPADAELSALASRTRDSLSHSFSQSGVTVKMVDSPEPDGRSASDYVIAGELSRAGDKVLASIRLDETTQGVTLLSKRFEAQASEAADLPERVGAQMAGNLGWAAPLMTLSREHPTDPSVTADLLQAHDFTGDALQGYQINRRAAAADPDSAMANVSLAFSTSFVIHQLPRPERRAALVAGRRAADRALKLAPEFGDTYGAWCLLHSETRFAECEDRLRLGKRIDPAAPFLDTFLANLMRSTGRHKEAAELMRLSYSHDPYVPTKIGWMLRAQEFDGEMREAAELYKKSSRWWPEYLGSFFWNRFAGLLERGDFDGIVRLEKEVGRKGVPPDYVGSASLVAAMKSKSRTGVARFCAGGEGLLLELRCMTALANVGDHDGAFAIADKLYPAQVGRTPSDTERIWLDNPAEAGPTTFVTSPASAALRTDARYLDLARRVGLLAYWRSGRPPDFCRKQPEPICAALMKRGRGRA